MNPPKSADAKKLTLPRVPDGLARKVLWCILALRRVAAAAGVNLQIVGSSRASTGIDGQIQLKVEGGGAGAIVDGTPIWGIRDDYKITPGTIGGKIPTYSGNPVSPIGSAIAVPTSGDHRLWFKVTFTVSKDGNGFLTSQSVQSVVIQNTEPTVTETVKKLLLLECADGVWTLPMVSGSRSAVLCNTGPDETTPTFAAV